MTAHLLLFVLSVQLGREVFTVRSSSLSWFSLLCPRCVHSCEATYRFAGSAGSHRFQTFDLFLSISFFLKLHICLWGKELGDFQTRDVEDCEKNQHLHWRYLRYFSRLLVVFMQSESHLIIVPAAKCSTNITVWWQVLIFFIAACGYEASSSSCLVFGHLWWSAWRGERKKPCV